MLPMICIENPVFLSRHGEYVKNITISLQIVFGHLDAAAMLAVNRALAAFLGFA
ncbi:MAG: hypothetical protein ACKVN9_07040 [Methylophilaceae bacterium]